MSLLIAGSIATDHLMTFGGQVRRLAGRRAARQAVGLLPRRRPRDPPRRLRRQHLLRPRPARAAAGAGRCGRRGLRRLPLLARAPRRRLRLGAHLRGPAHRPLRVHDRRDDGAVRQLLPRRDERGPADRAGPDRAPRGGADVRARRAGRPAGDGAAHPGVPPARLRVHRRPEPAAGLRRGRHDPRAGRRGGVPLLQRVRVAPDRVRRPAGRAEEILDARRHPGDHAGARRRADRRA